MNSDEGLNPGWPTGTRGDHQNLLYNLRDKAMDAGSVGMEKRTWSAKRSEAHQDK